MCVTAGYSDGIKGVYIVKRKSIMAVICDELNISADSIIYGDEPREEEVWEKYPLKDR